MSTPKMFRFNLWMFDKAVQAIKRLVLDGDVNNDEAAALAVVTDEVNEVRENYVNRKEDEIESCESSGS